MPRHSFYSLHRERRSLSFASGPEPFGTPSLYRHMFFEDVAIGIMPLGGQFRPARLRVTLDPSDDERAKLIGEALHHGRDSDLADGLCDFLRRVGSRVCEEDTALYEIVYLREKPDGPPVAFELVALDNEQLVRRRRKWFQVIPPEVARRQKTGPRIHLPEDSLMAFTLPKLWRSRVRDVRETLGRLGDPGFFGLNIEAQKAGIPYDFQEHQRHLNLALAEVGRSLGWTARGSFNGEVLSYTWIRMQLKFERFKIQLREALLDELNAGLRKVGAAMGFSATIKLDGLPTENSVETALRDLHEGKMAFTEVMREFEGQA